MTQQNNFKDNLRNFTEGKAGILFDVTWDYFSKSKIEGDINLRHNLKTNDVKQRFTSLFVSMPNRFSGKWKNNKLEALLKIDLFIYETFIPVELTSLERKVIINIKLNFVQECFREKIEEKVKKLFKEVLK
ncbi:MAG: hypothetical protein ACJAV6_000472 [Candidatus Paceibacteria bacterium]|jgi:hypothetical protein